LLDIVTFAWHFLKFGREGDSDAYWLGMWTVCLASATVASLLATITYMILFGRAMKREEAEATVGEMSETAPLLGNAVSIHLQTSGRTDTEVF